MILSHPFFTEILFPFLLVFVVVFAILQKTKILGDGKAQIDLVVAMVVGFLLVGVPGPRDIIIGLMPWMAVGISILLVFLVLYGFVAGDLSNMPDGLKYTLGGLAAVFSLVIVLYVSGWGSWLLSKFNINNDGWMSIVVIAIIIGAVFFVLKDSKSDSE